MSVFYLIFHYYTIITTAKIRIKEETFLRIQEKVVFLHCNLKN